ncbi:MAG: MotA/TolQ/ExbB proton channel family protein [Verrucomicrobiota bacterium]
MTLSFIEGAASCMGGLMSEVVGGSGLAAGSVMLVWEFLRSGGFFMIFIGLCSLVALAVAVHRAICLRWKYVISPDLEAELKQLDRRVRDGDTDRLVNLVADDDSTLGRIARTAFAEGYEDRQEATTAVEASAREEVVHLQFGMAILEVVITIAPLLGLLGTVSGLVGVFGTLGDDAVDGTDPKQVARGIAEALNSTIAGLAVAIPAVVAHSYFMKKIERLSARLEVIMSDVIGVLYRSPSEEEMAKAISRPGPGEVAMGAPAPKARDVSPKGGQAEATGT